jgi:hypothetical protein
MLSVVVTSWDFGTGGSSWAVPSRYARIQDLSVADERHVPPLSTDVHSAVNRDSLRKVLHRRPAPRVASFNSKARQGRARQRVASPGKAAPRPPSAQQPMRASTTFHGCLHTRRFCYARRARGAPFGFSARPAEEIRDPAHTEVIARTAGVPVTPDLARPSDDGRQNPERLARVERSATRPVARRIPEVRTCCFRVRSMPPRFWRSAGIGRSPMMRVKVAVVGTSWTTSCSVRP